MILLDPSSPLSRKEGIFVSILFIMVKNLQNRGKNLSIRIDTDEAKSVC